MHILQKLFWMLLCSGLMAQNGERIFEFMNIPTSARQTALGGYGDSKYDKDPNLALWNPSLMNEQMHMQAGFTYTSYLTDVKYQNLSYVHQISDQQFLAIHGRYLDYGDFEGYDEYAQNTGSFSAKDAAISLGYAYELDEFLTFGTNISYINSQIETYKASAVLMDFAATFHDYDYYNTVSVSLRNVGFLLQTYEDTKEKLPIQLNFSYSWKPEFVPIELSLNFHDLQNWDLAEPFNQNNGKKTGFGKELLHHLAFGAELFPDKGFNLRLGYNFKRGSELAVQDARSFSGLNFGFGVKISKFKLDYAHSRYHNASHVNSFGIRIDFLELLDSRR